MLERVYELTEWLFIRIPADLFLHRALRVRRMFEGIGANGKVIILTSFFWMVPVAFAGVYLQIFMKKQGLSALEIGSIASAQMVFQLAGSLVGGWFTERFGWKRTLVWADLVVWPGAMLCYATATGYTGFLAGSMLMGVQAMVVPSWFGMLSGGTPPTRRAAAFALHTVPSMVGNLLMPLAGPLVHLLGVSLSARLVFAGGAALMVAGVMLRQYHLHEYGNREMRIRPSLGELRRMVLTNWQALKALLKRKKLLMFFSIQLVNRAAFAIGSVYTYLYLADSKGLGIDESMLSMLPLFFGGSMLFCMLFTVPFITLSSMLGYMMLSVGLKALYIVLLLVAPPGALGVVIAGMLIFGWSSGIQTPTMSSYYANLTLDAERPRIMAVTSLLLGLLAMPVPTIAGATYLQSPRNPLLMLIALFAVEMVLMAILVIIETRSTLRRRPARG